MSRTLAIILAALLVIAIPFYLFSRGPESNPGVIVDGPMGNQQTSEGSNEPTSDDQASTEEIPFDEQWERYLVGKWEWLDEGKELIFEFHSNRNFVFYEKAFAENPGDSEDKAGGMWEVTDADNFNASVNLVAANFDSTEILFRLQFIDESQMAGRTDDMPEDVYVLFQRLDLEDSQ